MKSAARTRARSAARARSRCRTPRPCRRARLRARGRRSRRAARGGPGGGRPSDGRVPSRPRGAASARGGSRKTPAIMHAAIGWAIAYTQRQPACAVEHEAGRVAEQHAEHDEALLERDEQPAVRQRRHLGDVRGRAVHREPERERGREGEGRGGARGGASASSPRGGATPRAARRRAPRTRRDAMQHAADEEHRHARRLGHHRRERLERRPAR